MALSDVRIDLFRSKVDRHPQVAERHEVILELYPEVARFDDASRRGSTVMMLAGPGRE